MKKSNTASTILEKAKARLQAKKQAEEEAKQKEELSVAASVDCNADIFTDNEEEVPKSKSKARELLDNARLKTNSRSMPVIDTGYSIMKESPLKYVNKAIADDKTHPVVDGQPTVTPNLIKTAAAVPSIKVQGTYHGKYLAVASRVGQSRNKTLHREENEIMETANKDFGKGEFSVALLRCLYLSPSLLGQALSVVETQLPDLSSECRGAITSIVSDMTDWCVEDYDGLVNVAARVFVITEGNMAAQNALGYAGVSKMVAQMLRQVVTYTSTKANELKESYSTALNMILTSISVLLKCCDQQLQPHAGNLDIFVQNMVLESLIDTLQNWSQFDDIVETCLSVTCHLLSRDDVRSRVLSMGMYDCAAAMVQKYRGSDEHKRLCFGAYSVLMYLVTVGKFSVNFVQSGFLNYLINDYSDCDESMACVICCIIGVLVNQDRYTHCLYNQENFHCVKSLMHRFSSSKIVIEHAFYALSQFSLNERCRSDISSTDFFRECIMDSLRVNKRMDARDKIYSMMATIAMLTVYSFQLEESMFGMLAEIFRKCPVYPVQAMICLAFHNIITKYLSQGGSCFEKSEQLCTDIITHFRLQLKETKEDCARPEIIASVSIAVSALANLNSTIRLQFCHEGICELLTKALTVYEGHVGCTSLLESISSVCGSWVDISEPCVLKFIESNVQSDILSIWKKSMAISTGQQLVEAACLASGKLCSVQEGRSTSLSISVLQLAIDSLKKYEGSAEIVCAAGWNLTNLALSKDNWSAMSEVDILGPVGACLQCHISDAKVVIPCLSLMCRLVEMNDVDSFVGDVNISELLMKVFECHSTSTDVLLLAQHILRVLIKSDKMMEGVLHYNLHLRLIDGLKMFDTDGSLMKLMCHSIALMVSHYSPTELLSISSLLVHAMQSHFGNSVTCGSLIELGLEVISAGGIDSAAIRSKMGEGDIFILVVRNLSNGSTQPAFVIQNCQLLSALCLDHTENVTRCLNIDVWPVILALLQKSYDSNNALLTFAYIRAMSVLLATSNDNRTTLGFLGFPALLAVCLARTWNEKDEVIKTNCLWCIYYLSGNGTADTGNQLRIIEVGICKAITTVVRMYKSNERIIDPVFSVIISLSAAEQGKKAFFSEGIWHIIADALIHFADKISILIKIFGSVSILSLLSENVAMFEEKNVYRTCVDLVRKYASSVYICRDFLKVVSSVIGISSSDLKFSRQKMWVDLNIGPILCEIGNRYADVADLVLSVCNAVSRLSDNNEEISLMLATCGACDMICYGMDKHGSDADVAASSCSALHALAWSHVSNKSRIERCGGCASIVKLLAHHQKNPLVVREACVAISALCEGCEANVLAFANNGGRAIVTDTLELHITDSVVSEAASNAATALLPSNGDSDGWMDGSGRNACVTAAETLWNAMANSDDAAVLSALSTVTSLSENNIINQLEFGHAGACGTLTDLLMREQQHESVDGDGAILRAMNSLCRHGREFTSFVSENVARLIDAGAAEVVYSELQSKSASPDVCIYGSSILFYFFTNCSDSLNVIDMQDLCDTLHTILVQHLRNAVVAELVCIMIEHISCSLPDTCLSMFNAQTVTALVDAFRIHSGKAISEKATFAACKAISTLLEFAPERMGPYVEVTEFSILLVNIIDEKRSNPQFAALGCLTISRLLSMSSTDDMLSRFRQLGLCEVLIAILQIHVARVDVCYNACEAIYSLSDECPENQTRFGQGGVCATVVDLVGKLGDDVVFCRMACQTVCTLSSNHLENKLLFGSGGACAVLMHILQSYFSDNNLILYAIMAVRNLVGCPENITKIKDCNAFHVVSTLFLNHITVVEISEHCCAVLSNLIIERKQFKNEIDNTRLCDACVAELFQDNSDLQSHSMTCLLVANICSDHKSNSNKMISKGLCEGLSHLLVTHRGDCNFIAMVCAVISSFSGFDDCMKRCLSLGICSEIILSIEGISQFDQAAASEWCRAIAAMASCHSTVDFFVESNIIRNIQSVLELYLDDSIVVKSACRALSYLSQFESLRSQLSDDTISRLVLCAAQKNRADESVIDSAFNLLASINTGEDAVEMECYSEMVDANIRELIQYALVEYKSHRGITSSCLELIVRFCLLGKRIQKLASPIEICDLVYNLYAIHADKADFTALYYKAVHALVKGNELNAEEFLRVGIAKCIENDFTDLSSRNRQVICALCNIVSEISRLSLSSALVLSKTDIPSVIVKVLEEYSVTVPPDLCAAEVCESACEAISALCSKHSSKDAVMNMIGVRMIMVTTLNNFVSFPTVCRSVANAITSAITYNTESLDDFCKLDVGSALISALQLHIEIYDVAAALVCCIACLFQQGSESPFSDKTVLSKLYYDVLQQHPKGVIYMAMCDYITVGCSRKVIKHDDSKLLESILQHTNPLLGNTKAISRLCYMISHVCSVSHDYCNTLTSGDTIALLLAAAEQNMSSAVVLGAIYRALTALAEGNSDNIEAFGKCGGCDIILVALRNADTSPALLDIGATIQAYCQSSEENAASFLAHGGYEVLVDLLDRQSGSRDAVLGLCCALHSLEKSILNSCSINNDLMRGLLDTLKRTHEQDGEVLAAMLCLYSLASLQTSEREYASLQTSVALLSSLSANVSDEGLLTHTLNGVIALMQDDASSAHFLGKNDICDMLFRIVTTHEQSSPAMVEAMYLTIHHLCRNHQENTLKFRALKMEPMCFQALASNYQHSAASFAICCAIEDFVCESSLSRDVFNSSNIELIYHCLQTVLISKADLCGVTLRILITLCSCEVAEVKQFVQDKYKELKCVEAMCSLLKQDTTSVETICACFRFLFHLGENGDLQPSSLYSTLCPLIVSHMNTFMTSAELCDSGLSVLEQLGVNGDPSELGAVLQDNVCSVCLRILKRHIKQMAVVEKGCSVLLLMEKQLSFVLQDEAMLTILECFKAYGSNSARVSEFCLGLFLAYFRRRDAVFSRKNEFGEAVKSVLSSLGTSAVIVERILCVVSSSIQFNGNEEFADTWRHLKISECILPALNGLVLTEDIAMAACRYCSTVSRLGDAEALGELGACSIIFNVLKTFGETDFFSSGLIVIESVKDMCKECPKNALEFGSIGCCDVMSQFLCNIPDEANAEMCTLVIETVWMLCQDCISNKEKFVVNPLLPRALVKLMAIWDKSEIVAGVCCGALWHLVLNCSQGREIFITLKASDQVEHVMKIHHKSEDISRLGCGALWALSESHASTENRHSSPSSLRTLLDTITEHMEDPQIVSVGCVTLCNICIDNASALLLGSSGACEAVCAALRGHRANREVGVVGCDIISDLCMCSDNSKRMFDLGIMQIIYDICTGHLSDKDVCASALTAMVSVISNVEIRAVELMEFDISELVMSVFKAHPKCFKVHKSVLGVVVCLSELVPASVILLGNSGACEVTIASLNIYAVVNAEDESNVPVTVAMRAVYVLCRENSNTTRLVIAGLFGTLEGTLKKYSNIEKVSTYAAKIIQNMTDSNVVHRDQYQNALGDSGICEVLVHSLTVNMTDGDTVVEIIRAIIGVCLGHLDNISRVHECGGISGVQSVLEMYSLTNDSIARSICGLIVVLNADPGCAEALGKLGICDLVVNSFANAVQNRDEDAIETICYTLVSLIRGNSGNQAAFGKHKDVALLVTSVLSGWARTSVGAEEAGLWVISLLCKHSKNDDSVCMENIEKLNSVGGASAVVSTVLRHITDVDCCIAGGQALCNLSLCKRLDILSQLGASGACEAVIKILRDHISNIACVEATVDALVNLSLSPDNVVLLKKIGVCDVIINLCQVYSSHFDIVISICRSLKNLGQDNDCSDKFSLASIHQFAIDICIRDPDAERGTVVDVLECLRSIFHSRDGYFTLICDGTSAVLVDIILAKWIPLRDYEIVMNAYSVLKQILQCGSDRSLKKVQMTLCESLLSVFKEFSNDADIVCEACNVTRLLSLQSDECTQYITELGIHEFIVSAMHSLEDNLQVSSTAALTLQTILTDISTRNDMGLRSTSDVVLKSLRRYNNDSDMVEQNCAALLQIANKGLRHVTVLTEMGVCEIMVSILRKYSQKLPVLTPAVSIIECLCQSESSVIFMGGIGMCEAIVGAFRRHTAEDVVLINSFLRILESFTVTLELRSTLGLSGCCEIISSLLSSAIDAKCSDVVVACARNIRLLCVDNPTNSESFGMTGTCVLVSNAISSMSKERTPVEALLLAARLLCQQDSDGELTNKFNIDAFKNSLINEQFIETFRLYIDTESTAIIFLMLLQSLSSDPESLSNLYELGACDLIIDIISRPVEVSSELSICVVAVMECYVTEDVYTTHLFKNGADTFMIGLLKGLEQWHDRALQSVFNVVTAFAKFDSNMIDKLIKNEACRQIIVSVQSRESLSSSLIVALGAVIEVFGSDQRAICEFEQCNAGHFLWNTWTTHETDSTSVAAIARAVLMLTNHRLISQKFIAEGGCDILVKCIRRFMITAPIISKVITIIAQIITLSNSQDDNTGTIALFFEAGLCDIMLAVLRRYSENPDILAKCCSVFALLALNEEISSLLGNGGACEGAVHALNMFDNDVRVVQYSCRAIRNLGVLPANRTILLLHEATRYIVAVLKRFVHTENVVVEACAALVNLHGDASSESTQQISRILGAADDLAKVVTIQIDSSGVVEQVFTLLKILAADNSSREVLGMHDICRSLPGALLKHFDVSTVVERGLGAITRISYRSVQNKALFSQTDLCEVIMKIYDHYFNNVKILELCCVAMTSLCTSCDKNIHDFVHHGISGRLEETISKYDDNVSVCNSVCQTVARLCKLEEGLNRFDSINMSKLLCSILHRHISNSALTRSACDALKCFGTSESLIQEMLEVGVSSSLVKGIVNYASNKECTIAIMAAAAVLSTNSMNFASRLGDDGMCEALVLALDENKEHLSTTSAIMKTLVVLSKCETNQQRLASSKAFDLFASSMRTFCSDYDFSLKCCESIANISTTDQSRKYAAVAGICESIARVFELYEDDKDVVSAAAIATAKVALDNSANADRCAKTKLCLMIFRAIETHMHDSDTVASLLFAVSSLATTVLNRRFFGGGDGCELVKIALLKNMSCRSVCINGASAVSAISTDSFENKETYGKIGMIDILAKIVRNNKEYGDVVVAACNTLNTLCTEHTENAERISRESIAEFLVGAIRSHMSDEDVVVAVLKLIINILQHQKSYVDILKRLDAREIFITLMDTHRNTTLALMYIVRILRDVYACEEDTSSIDPIANECLFLTNALAKHPSDININEDICGIIFLISRKRMSRSVSLFGDCGACELISDSFRRALEHNNMSLAKMALLAAVSLCSGSCSNQTKFGESGACSAVVSILKNMGGSSSDLCTDMEGVALNFVAMLVRHGKLKSSENGINTQKLLDEGACEIVTGCLDKRLDNMALVYSACRAIFCLASDDSCAHRLLQCGAGDLVVRVLSTYQSVSTIAQYAVGAVANLGYTDSGARSLHFNGVCDALIKALSTHKKDVHIAQHGCNALKNLSVDDIDIRAALGAAGACKVLLSILKIHSDNHGILCPALLAISNLIMAIPTHAETFMQAQIDHKLLKIVQENLSTEAVCSSAFAVIGNLCDHEFSKRSLIDVGVINLITKVVKAHVNSVNTVVRCFVSLVRLNGEDHATSIVKDDKELCDLVVEILKIHALNEVVVDVTCKVLVCLGKNSEYNRLKLVEYGAAEQAILILSKNSSDPVCVSQICRVVIFLACDSRSKGLLTDLGICHRIVAMLSTYKSDAELAKLLAEATTALATDCSANTIELTNNGIIPQLLDSFRSHSSDSATGGCICHALEAVLENSTDTIYHEEVTAIYSVSSIYFHHFWENPFCAERACRLIVL